MNLNNKNQDDELELLLAESTQPKRAAVADDMDELDALLSESIQIRDEADATKALREKLKRNKLSSTERQEIEAKVREWDSRHVWTPIAVVAVFEKVVCACGFYTEAFSHMMHKQRHKHEHSSTRLVRDENIPAGLPKMVARQVAEVEFCGECAAEHGWDMETAEEIEWHAPAMKA